MKTILLLCVSAALSAQVVVPQSKIQLNQVQPPTAEGPRLMVALPVALPAGGTVTLWAQVAIGTGLVLDTTSRVPTLSAVAIAATGTWRSPVVLSRNTDGLWVSPDAACSIGLVFRNGLLQFDPGDYTISAGAVKFAPDDIVAGERISATCR